MTDIPQDPGEVSSNSAALSCSSTLWMGNVEPYMDESFISSAFSQMGETVLGVKLIRMKTTGQLASYCFVEFPDPDSAQRSMLRLNGKVVPGSQPPNRFKLNYTRNGKGSVSVPEYSLFVGDLPEETDDLQLYQVFSSKYRSTRSAKVVQGEGRSRGYGFVRFTDEADQKRALMEMQGSNSFGKKPIRVCLATPKAPGFRPPGAAPPGAPGQWPQQQQYPQQYPQQNPQQYGGWGAPGSYGSWGGQQGWGQQGWGQQGWDGQQWQGGDWTGYEQQPQQEYSQQGEDEESLEDPTPDVDIDQANQEFMEQSEELYTALEGSRWHPLDNVMSTIIPQSS
jgi:RNA recognition motif-containing protein